MGWLNFLRLGIRVAVTLADVHLPPRGPTLLLSAVPSEFGSVMKAVPVILSSCFRGWLALKMGGEKWGRPYIGGSGDKLFH
jgi:hypothetical protein